MSSLGSPAATPSLLDKLHAQSLNFLYFGLLSVGIATAAFGTFSPDAIRFHPFVADYIKHMEAIRTHHIASISFSDLVDKYWHHTNGEQRSPFFAGTMPNSFPDVAASTLHHLVEAGFNISGMGDLKNGEYLRGFYTGAGAGMLQTDLVLEAMHLGRLAERSFCESINNSIIINCYRDVFYAYHLSLDYSNFFTRSSILFLYIIGFSLTSIPTIITSIIIIRNL